MNAAPCNRPALGYTGARSLENSHRAETRTRQTCGFFVPAFHGQGAPTGFHAGGVPGNNQYLEPSLCGFEPPLAPIFAIGRFTFELMEKPR